MLHAVFELDHDGLLHLVRDHIADHGLAASPRLLLTRSSVGTRGARLARATIFVFCHHDSSPLGPLARPSSRSRSTVYMRAISRRTMRSRRLFGSCPVAI